MFDLKTDNQLTSLVAGLASVAVLATGAAGVALAQERNSDSARESRAALAIERGGAERRESRAERAREARQAERRAARERKQAARRKKREQARMAAASGPVEGVPRATLDAIAACESGGNPAAVNPAGYYGKYQFSISTWQAVGGSGNPAAASEAEQDMRAAMLYNRAGPGQWPVCGQ